MNNWPLIKLGKILTESKIEATNSDANKRIRVLLNAKGVIKRPLTKETEGATKYFERKKGQFIYGKQNLHKGAFGIVPNELDGYSSSSDLPAFDVSKECEPEWINYFLRQGDFYLSLIDIAKGAATKRIQPKSLFEVEIPLPEIAVQKKIIKQFIAQEEKAKIIESEIQTQKQLLSQLKQSILQEAIQGKLTADWRAQNPISSSFGGSAEGDGGLEPASELLKRIKTEKAQLIKDKKIKKEKALPPITAEEIPFELPPNGGWVWCRLGDIASNFDYGTSTKSTSSGKYPVLRMGNIQDGKIDWNNLKYTDNLNDFNQYQLYRGDLLFNRTNSREMVGKTALYDSDRYAIHAGYLVRVRLIEPTNEFYANTVLNSTLHREWCDSVKSDALGQSNINATKLKSFLFPLPPLEEQKAIVEKVETLMRKCDGLEQEIKSSEANAQMFMQAVLKEAFEGEKEVVEV